LREHFHNDIECHTIKKDVIILYKGDIASKKLCKEWYEKRFQKEVDERARIVEMAAQIVLEDIRSEKYDMTCYEIPDLKEESLFKDVPYTLKLFLDIVCKTHKDKSKSNL